MVGKRGHVIAESFQAINMSCIYQRRINGPRRIWGVLYEIFKQLLDHPKTYDFVLADNLEYLPFAYFVSKVFRIPLIIRERGDGWAEVKQKETAGGYRLPGAIKIMDVYSAILRQCAAVFCVSEYLKTRVKKNADVEDKRLFTLPISVEINTYETVSKESPQAKMGKNRKVCLLSVTNFRYPEKVKKIEEFMPAIVSLLKKNPNSEFLIAGDGSYLKTFEKNIKFIIGPVAHRINVLGYVKDIHVLYSTADIVFYLSGLDAFPRVILESMASSRPVIANPFGGIPEMIENEKNGFLVNNHEDFLAYAQMLIDDNELREKIGKAAREHIANNYTPELVGLKWIETLNEIMEIESE